MTHTQPAYKKKFLTPLQQNLAFFGVHGLVFIDNESATPLIQWLCCILLCSCGVFSSFGCAVASTNEGVVYSEFDISPVLASLSSYVVDPKIRRDEEETYVSSLLDQLLRATGWILDAEGRQIIVRCSCAVRKNTRHWDALASDKRDLGLATTSYSLQASVSSNNSGSLLSSPSKGFVPSVGVVTPGNKFHNLKELPGEGEGLSMYEFFSGIG
jgi:hypothetical protein